MRSLARPNHRSGVILFILLLLMIPLHAEDSAKRSEAFVESVRKDGIATVTSMEKPAEARYAIGEKGSGGALTILQTFPVRTKGALKYRSIVRWEGVPTLRTGTTILLREYREVRASYIGEKSVPAATPYKTLTVTARDRREMVLVSEGKFPFGSDDGDADESPRRLVRLENYYIDRNEVSNADYLLYVNENNAQMPRSWGGVFPEAEKDLPVIVSYTEAAAYAAWAGKRLPTEQEWEKAANGSRTPVLIQSRDGYTDALEKTVYPWGNAFEPSRCNGLETGRKGYLPVNEGDRFDSAWGAAHMAGNAPEWTDSWYAPYEGSSAKNSKYGKKYKVIRGGAWYSTRERLRITARETGGSPNLDEDVIAGFRCVKEPAEQDRR